MKDSKALEALNEMYAVLNDSDRWHKHKSIIEQALQPTNIDNDEFCNTNILALNTLWGYIEKSDDPYIMGEIDKLFSYLEKALTTPTKSAKEKAFDMIIKYWNKGNEDYHYFLEGLRDIVEKSITQQLKELEEK